MAGFCGAAGIARPFLLALKAEALHLAWYRYLRSSRDNKGGGSFGRKDLERVTGLPNCTAYAVCFSRL